MADISPPDHLLANNGRGDRMVLVAKCTEWHRKQPADKHISYYVNPAFLDLPATKVLPQKWSDQRARSSYRSFAAGMRDIEEYDLAPKQMKKVIEPYLFLYAEMNTSINTIQSFFPQFSNESTLGGRANRFLEKTRKRPGEISYLMITKVGTAILLYVTLHLCTQLLILHSYMIQDQRFFSHALGPLPPFDTPEERKTWFSQILTEKPLLCVLFVFSLYRSSIDVPFIYSEWKYNDRLNRLKEDLQELIRLRLCELLELVFRAHFNLARTQLVVNTETYRTWVRTRNSIYKFQLTNSLDNQQCRNSFPFYRHCQATT